MIAFPTIQTRVAGVSFDNRDGSSRQTFVRRTKKGDVLVLRREPENFFDANAIAVDWLDPDGNPCQLGYVPRNLAAVLAHVMDRGATLSAQVLRKGGGGHRLAGVRITIDLEVEGTPYAEVTGLEPVIQEAMQADKLEEQGFDPGFAPMLGGQRAV
jgi:hypothetical protein